jgi:hypothetical protein
VAKSTPRETAGTSSTASGVKLRDPAIAALLAWCIPGLGHLYQRRTSKGLLFMATILGTFLYGLIIGDGRVVYASWKPDEVRLHYLCQAGVGLPAMPALVQALRHRGRKPTFGSFMAPPADDTQRHEWHYTLNRSFELGTIYTMIAGLLNILVIYDAFSGPAQRDDEVASGAREGPTSGTDPPEDEAPG